MDPKRHVWLALLAFLAPVAALPGCWLVRPSQGGGEGVPAAPVRRVDPADVVVPVGYRVEAIATGLTFPTGVGFDGRGGVYVIESGYSYGEVWTRPRLLRIEAGRPPAEVALGEHPPWTGLSYHDGAFIVSEGGERGGGRIVRVGLDGTVTPILAGLPSLGDHHTNRPVVGPDGWIYFGQGTATNTGVVGEDNFKFGWAHRHPTFHDVPGRDLTLAGESFTGPDPRAATPDPRGSAPPAMATTGPYLPFGTPARAGQVIKGQVPFTGGIMRVRPTGGAPELVAWGMRNPFSLAFAPDGSLYATENGPDERGSRPVYGAGDVLWKVERGRWYGWPDYMMGKPVTDAQFNQNPQNPKLRFVLAKHPGKPPAPAAILGVHASANGLDFSRSAAFGHRGQAFVAEFGDMAPDVGKVAWPVGFRVVRVDPATGDVADFAHHPHDGRGPASKMGTGGLERPVDVRFDPSGEALYVVDFGVMAMTERGPAPQQGTGVLWRIARAEAKAGAPAPDVAAIARGRQVFMQHCHHCHPGGSGGLGPGVADKPLPGGAIKIQVRAGLGTMPAFGPDQISAAQLDDLVTYIYALRKEKKAKAKKG